ncbi:uncharacterized protein LOC131950638 [Physella acuta]|uniref:uncharacterized protein LOC131950638 n=1 Tax=Physella acuta TaxID=109671 RepID=UPI0027DBF4E1|nr:uncharacterized protein LOC131950638 [Physella acuta]
MANAEEFSNSSSINSFSLFNDTDNGTSFDYEYDTEVNNNTMLDNNTIYDPPSVYVAPDESNFTMTFSDITSLVNFTSTADISTLADLTSYGLTNSTAVARLFNTTTLPLTDPTTLYPTLPALNITAVPNISELERLQYLGELQQHTSLVMIPAMIFLITLSITGLIGNSLVLFVYSQRFRKTSTRIYVLAIASFDIVANVLCIPGEIYDMFHIWDFDNRPLCRARLFFNAFSTLSSAMVLLAVAVARYRKVCVPYGWQTTIKQAQYVSVLISFLGVLFSIPYVLINGRQTKKTPRSDISGYECTTDDDYVNTIWPLLNGGFFFVLFIFCCVPFICLYVRIGLQAWRHSAIHGSSSNVPQRSYTTNSSSIDQIGNSNNNIPSSVKPKVLGLRRKSEKSVCSTPSADFGSVEDDIAAYVEDEQTLGSSDKYTVRILDDRVEVSTPMMGDFIVQLKNATTTGDVISLDEIKSETVAENSPRPKRNTVAGSSKVNTVEFSNRQYIDNDREKQNVDSKTDIRSNNTDIKMDTNVNNSNPISSNRNIENNIQNNEGSQERIFVVEREKPEVDKTGEEPETADEDPVAALKWIDIIFCPQQSTEPEPDTKDSKEGNGLSFRLSTTNSILQKTEWLRNIVSEALKSKARKRSNSKSTPMDNLNIEMKPTSSEGTDDVFYNQIESPSSIGSVHTGRPSIQRLPRRKSSTQTVNQPRRRPLGRTTAMLISISAVYTLSFIPYLILSVFRIASPDQYDEMGTAEMIFYNLFLRTYFLNCAANPIIYSLCDVNFRRECQKLLGCLK